MLLFHWLSGLNNGLFGSRRKSRQTRRPVGPRGSRHLDAAFACEPEALEDRTLLSTFVVNTRFDQVNPNDGVTSLREAINSANLSFGADEIQFAASLQNQTIVLDGTQLPTISGQLSITGPGSDLLSISGNNQSRVFEVGTAALVFVSGVAISHGQPTDPHPVIPGERISSPGGGIYNAGTLTGTDLRVIDNTASRGGGIYNSGFLSLAESVVADNAADSNGGGLYSSGELVLRRTTVNDNTAGGITGQGGGIYTSGTASVFDSTISGNNLPGGYGTGIAVSAGTLDVDGSTISGNGTTSGGMGFLGGIASVGNTRLENSTVSGNRLGLYVRDDCSERNGPLQPGNGDAAQYDLGREW